MPGFTDRPINYFIVPQNKHPLLLQDLYMKKEETLSSDWSINLTKPMTKYERCQDESSKHSYHPSPHHPCHHSHHHPPLYHHLHHQYYHYHHQPHHPAGMMSYKGLKTVKLMSASSQLESGKCSVMFIYPHNLDYPDRPIQILTFPESNFLYPQNPDCSDRTQCQTSKTTFSELSGRQLSHGPTRIGHTSSKFWVIHVLVSLVFRVFSKERLSVSDPPS